MLINRTNLYRATGLGLFVLLGAACNAQKMSALKLEPTGTKEMRLGYFPVQLKLSDVKPASIKKEPTYAGKPMYGSFRLGNGPQSTYTVVLDEPEGGAAKIYLDTNRNGDISDDGDGDWGQSRSKGRVMHGVKELTLRASWGDAKHEKSSGDYGVAFYRFPDIPNVLLMYRQGVRTGEVTIDKKQHKARLVENDADALYSKPLDDEGKSAVKGIDASRPVWLLIDMEDKGFFGSPINIRSPFKLGGKNYVAKVEPDGSKLRFEESKREPVVAKVSESKPLLKAGVTAPNFLAQAWGGADLHLSDYKGKVVILDFWATWCGPCQQSMPHVEKLYQSVKDKGVIVLGLCVSDEKASYEKWVPEHLDKFHFQFAYDPAGRNSAKNISLNLFNVTGIPTTYVIDKEGNVADAIVGFEGDDDKRIEAALKKLGIEADAK